jgi:hypothetical protein
MENVFERTYGSDLLRKPVYLGIFLTVMLYMGYLIATKGMVTGIGLLILPALATYFYVVFTNTRYGLLVLFVYNFFVLGSMRYIKDVPLGLGVDGQIILMYLALFFKSFFYKIPWENAKRDVVLLAAIWFGYALFQLVNPEAVSREAWFYAMRGPSLYMILTIPLILILFNKYNDLILFFKIWAVLSLLATLKGMMQQHIGPDPWEQAWLDGGGDLTHVLFGKLRIFSFFSDAGQFGAAQGHSAVVFLILAQFEKESRKWKYFYGLVGILALYGMMISGTRGAIAVPIMGLAVYVVLSKNIKVMILGGILGLGVFVFFKYTTIGSGNYTINRMRTAFDPEDASLQVRLENQRKLKAYMATRPFGGGIGSAGNWGMRFTPNTFLAQTPTDSWYVMIWAEQGIIGLMLHLFILFYIVIKGSYYIMFRVRDPALRAQLSALVAGMFGIMVASYGNGVLGQMPTGIIMYSSMAFLFLAEELDREIHSKKQLQTSKFNENKDTK